MNVIKRLGEWLAPVVCAETSEAATQSRDLMASLLTMAWFVDVRDPYTAEHLWRDSRYAMLMADASLGGFLHDLGTVDVPVAVLRRPDRLSDVGIPLQSCPMCGPTLRLRREQQVGDRPYCRNCSAEFAVKAHASKLRATQAGSQGQAPDLEPQVGPTLVARTVRAAVTAEAGDMKRILQPALRALGAKDGRRETVVMGTALNGVKPAGCGIVWLGVIGHCLVSFCVAGYSAARIEPNRSSDDQRQGTGGRP